MIELDSNYFWVSFGVILIITIFCIIYGLIMIYYDNKKSNTEQSTAQREQMRKADQAFQKKVTEDSYNRRRESEVRNSAQSHNSGNKNIQEKSLGASEIQTKALSVPQAPAPFIGYSPVDELCKDYNSAVQNGNLAEFKRKYKPITTTIGLLNGLDYMNDRSINPIFVPKDDGNFIGITIEQVTYVMPRLGMTFIEIDHGPGAMSKVFKCPCFDQNKKYSQVNINEPAIFVQSGSKYLLKSEGKINLGNGVDR